METTTAKPVAKKGVSTALIVVLIVILVGGGVGIFFALKPKTEEEKKEQQPTTDEQGGASGREVSGYQWKVPDHVLAALLETNKPKPPPQQKGSTAANPLYFKSEQALQLIADTAKEMQLHEPTMTIIRASYNIGKSIMSTSIEEQECIDQLFGTLRNVDLTTDPDRRYLAYPVYGTFEPQGKKYRAELQKLINAGWEGLNLTDLRNSSAPWWCKELGLNLLMGTTWPNTPKTTHVARSWVPRTELDFYKKFNRYWVDDVDLADVYINRHNTQQVVWKDHPDARSAYCATGMYEFVKRWVSEIDRLDEMTRFEAFKWLQQPDENGVRWFFTYINPDTGADEEDTSSNPFNIHNKNKGKGGKL